MNFERITYAKQNYPPKGIEKMYRGSLLQIKGEYNILVNFSVVPNKF